jgi:beta-ketoacyl synthase-like protein
MSRLVLHVEGIGVVGPGLSDWPTLRALLANGRPLPGGPTVVPAPALLPPAERRRVGVTVKLALAAGLEAVTAAGLDAATLPTVFAAAGGDGANCHAICEQLAGDDRLISPTRFHNSVHNAASGYWGIATGAMAPSAIVAAYDGSFAAGLLEAAAQLAADGGRILLVAHDAPYPEPLHGARPLAEGFGVGMVLAAEAGNASLGELRLTLTAEPATEFAEPGLEVLRRGVPAARCLPLLAPLARRESGRVVLDYLDDLRLAVDVAPGVAA